MCKHNDTKHVREIMPVEARQSSFLIAADLRVLHYYGRVAFAHRRNKFAPES